MKSFETHWKVFVLTFLFQFFILIKEIEGKQISCESLSVTNWDWGSVGTVKTCMMEETTSIDKPEANILPHDGSVGGLDFHKNKKIFHLPDNVAATFSNLKAYSAWGCSLKEVCKQNFQGLVNLKVLGLSRNQIEKIASGTFKDLTALEELLLCK